MSGKPIVSIEFVFNGEHSKHINIADSAPMDVNAVTEASRISNTTFEYSGRHDHGLLPKLKCSGSDVVLVASLMEAKRECDKYLTERINEVYGYDDAEKIEYGGNEDEETLESKSKKLCVEKGLVSSSKCT